VVENTENRFQILALSGGGYKGLYTATIIAAFEKQTSRPFADHFDLIAGTSVGGIIALALACRIPAKDIVEMLQKHGHEIFPPLSPLPWYRFFAKKIRNLTGLDWDRGLNAAKHSNENLKRVLQEIFQERTMGDLEHRVLIPAVNWTKGLPQFFKTPHHERFTFDSGRSLVDVAMATSAAPIYLPNHIIESQIFVDGGLVGNAPGFFALHEAQCNIPHPEQKDVYLLSIGALSAKITANQDKSPNRGLLNWGENLISLMMASQEGATNYMLEQQLKDKYLKIDEYLSPEQTKAVGLDIATEGATQTLIGLGTSSAQNAAGTKFMQSAMEYVATKPKFHN
jgi:patatin-like phospholipase/acyl hydrolase